MSDPERTNIHLFIGMLGMRAQATAAGLVQLCNELHSSGLLDDHAVGRIKDAIAEELAQNAPRSTTKQAYLSSIHDRLDKVFGGREPVGRFPPDFTADTNSGA
jgi:hypothetical protein